MLGFLKPRGELVELSGRQVVFLTDKAYDRDTQIQIRLSLPEPATQKLDLDVRILSRRPAPEKKYVTVAVVETPRDFPNLSGFPTRDNQRQPHRLTMKSGDLPGFRAVTSDLSYGGFKTELEGELAVGDQLVITFEFDALQGFSIELLTQVQWVEKKGGAKFLTGFSFPDQGRFAEGYSWFCKWLDSREDTEVKKLFKPTAQKKAPPIPEELLPKEPEASGDPLEGLDRELAIRIPFKGFLRGWAWEQGDDMVVVVLEDDEEGEHWLEFPGCRALHARCRDRKIRLQGVGLVFQSPLINEYSRMVTMESLFHFQFLDDYARVCLDVVASGCREQRRKA